MGWFARKNLTDRFPIERMRFVPGGICVSIMNEADRVGFDRLQATRSKFACGYMLGYPDYLDGIDLGFGGKVRHLIFDLTFGHEDGRELYTRSLGHFLTHDEQTRFGWGCGAADGQRYFQALEEKRDATGTDDSLKLFAELGKIDFGEQVM